MAPIDKKVSLKCGSNELMYLLVDTVGIFVRTCVRACMYVCVSYACLV